MKSILIIMVLCFSAEVYAGDCPGGACPMPQQGRVQVRSQSAPKSNCANGQCSTRRVRLFGRWRR